MSQAVDSPVIVLFEDRPKQAMVSQLNLGIYLDARVTITTSLKDLKKALAGPDGVHLVIARATVKGAPLSAKILDLLKASGASVPVICLGDEKEREGLTVVGSEDEVKPMLQAAARLLGITAKHMVSKERPDTYEIAPGFLAMLFSFPCDIFAAGGKGSAKLFAAGDTVPRTKVQKLVKEGRPLVIESLQRLKLVNAVTEQSRRAAEDLADGAGVSDEKKMSLLSASLDMVAVQFQNAGMDEETVKLANASIKAVEKIASSATTVGSLVKQLLDAQGGYRYAHCQLVTFLGFHVIKMMGWWGDQQRETISQAAFYHDISLGTDELSMVRTVKAANDLSAKDPQQLELLLTHAQLAARELQTAPEISPEVVQVVLQHHGSPVGRGFSTDIAKLDVLARTFILSEEWGDYLLDLAQTDRPADNDAKIRELKAIYKDDQSQQILETFRYLDPSAFAQDFLVADEVDFAKTLASGGGEESGAESVAVPAGSAAVEPEQRLKADKAEKEPEQSFGAEKAEKEPEQRLKADEAEKESEQRFGADKAEKEPEQRFGADKAEKAGEKAARSVSQRAPRPVREPRLADLEKVAGEAGEKARELLSKIRAKKPNATPEEVDALLKAGGVTMPEGAKERIAADLKAEAEAEVVALGGSEGEAESSRTKIGGVTQHIEHEKVTVKGGNEEEEARKKIEGVTDVRKDETIVIKGDKPQDLVDRSLVRIKGDPQQAARELKMKTLAGSTDLMKAAITGDLPKVAEMLAAPDASVQLRKTDAEGRTVIHYAAMNGSVEALKALLEKGAQLNTVDSKRRSALFFAALYKHNEAFDFLLAQGAKVSQQALGGMTIAMVAATSGNLPILKTAVEKGVRLDAKDQSGKTALDFAKQANQAEAIAFLEAQSKPAAGAQPKAA